MKRLAIVGAGALGQQIAQHVTQTDDYKVAGFFDDAVAEGAATPLGPILGSVGSAQAAFERGTFDEILLGVGYRSLALRQHLFTRLSAGIPFGMYVHPTAYVDRSASVGLGAFISPGCLLDLNVELGADTFLYGGCVVAHDVRIGCHTFLAPGVRLAGRVQVGPRCFLGIGTTVIDNCILGSEVCTGAGTVVTHDLPQEGTYVGAPARRL